MVIANPIYDVVFKRIMENDKVAKFFIGTLLDRTIESIEVKPQEFTYNDERVGVSVFRLDFIATVKTDAGEYKKILIEVQKARDQIDLMRFRNYLAEQYKKKDVVDEKDMVLPITTIYILGFKLPEIESACIKVDRNYVDLINKETLDVKSDFVEKLTHDSYVVQVNRITDRYQTRLDKLLSVFEQSNFVDDNKIIKEFNHSADIDELKLMTDILHHSGVTPSEKKKIEIEQEAWRTVFAMLGDERSQLLKNLQEKEKEIREISKAVDEKEKELRDISKEVDEKEKQIHEKDQILSEKDQLIAELMRKLNEKE